MSIDQSAVHLWMSGIPRRTRPRRRAAGGAAPLARCATLLALGSLTLAGAPRVLAGMQQVAQAAQVAGAPSKPGICEYLDEPGRLSVRERPARRPAPSEHVRITASDDRLTIEVGPIDLPAGSGHHGVPQFPQGLAYVPRAGFVHGFRLELVDAEGHPVPRTVIHHLVTVRPSIRDLFLPVAQRFVAVGSETPATRMPPWLVSIPLQDGEPLFVDAMFHNPTERAYEGVRARLILDFSSRAPLYEVEPFHLDVMFPSGPKEWDLPPGLTERSWTGRPSVRGAILGFSGHLHTYAEFLEVSDVTEGERLWLARPIIDRDGNVISMPVNFRQRGFGYPIWPDHDYKITVVHDNPTGAVIPEGAMGKAAGIFILGAQEQWPPLPVTDPLFLFDLEVVLGSACGAAASHAH